MGDLTEFVDAIYNSCGKLIDDNEEDQKLPPREVLESVCQTLLNVSTMPEEGRFPPRHRRSGSPPGDAFRDP